MSLSLSNLRVANKTRFVFVAAPSLKSVSFFLADAIARNERVERRTDDVLNIPANTFFAALSFLFFLPLSPSDTFVPDGDADEGGGGGGEDNDLVIILRPPPQFMI